MNRVSYKSTLRHQRRASNMTVNSFFWIKNSQFPVYTKRTSGFGSRETGTKSWETSSGGKATKSRESGRENQLFPTICKSRCISRRLVLPDDISRL